MSLDAKGLARAALADIPEEVWEVTVYPPDNADERDCSEPPRPGNVSCDDRARIAAALSGPLLRHADVEQLYAALMVALAFVRRESPFNAYQRAMSIPPRKPDDRRHEKQIAQGEAARIEIEEWEERRALTEDVLLSAKRCLG